MNWGSVHLDTWTLIQSMDMSFDNIARGVMTLTEACRLVT